MVSFALIGDASLPFLSGISALGTVRAVYNPALPDQRHADRYEGSKAYNSLDALLANEPGISHVYIHTAAGFHAEIIIKSLQAGKEVICEAPLCITVAAAWQIIETAKFCRRKVTMTNPLRYQPEVRTLRNYLRPGTAKVSSFHLTCLLPAAADDSSFPSGSLLHRAGYFMDLVPWLLGPITEAKGLVKGGSEHKVEASGAAALELESGQLGTISWQQEKELRQGSFSLHAGSQKIELTTLSGEGAAVIYNEMFSDLALALQGKESSTFHLQEALRTVELLEKIYKVSSPAS